MSPWREVPQPLKVPSLSWFSSFFSIAAAAVSGAVAEAAGWGAGASAGVAAAAGGAATAAGALDPVPATRLRRFGRSGLGGSPRLRTPRVFVPHRGGRRSDGVDRRPLGRQRGGVPLRGFAREALGSVARAEEAGGIHREDGRRADRHEVVPYPLASGLRAFRCLVHNLQLRSNPRGVGAPRKAAAVTPVYVWFLRKRTNRASI